MTGLVTAFGSGAMTNAIEDIVQQARAFFVIGSNTTENHPVIGMGIRQAVKRGARLIVADPRRIPLTDFAALHLRQRPGTDIALLNGIANVLIAEDLHDRAYVAARTEGFDDLKAALAGSTPEIAEGITGVPARDIREAAHLLAANRPGALLYAMGITQHTTGHQNVLACANLQMLLGNIGVPGGGVNPLRGQNNVQGACDMGCLPNVYTAYQPVISPDVRAKFQNAWGRTSPARAGLTLVEMLDAAERGEVRGMFILGENPAMTDPDGGHVRRVLDALEFLVVQEIFPTETTAHAHVVLPGAAFAEKEGTFTNTERRVQLVRKAIDPPGQARPDWQILADLAGRIQARLGMDPRTGLYASWDYVDPGQIMEEIAVLTPSYGGVRHERLEKGGLQWPCPSVDHPGTRILHTEKFTRGLGRFCPVAWMPPAEQPDAEYPLVLTTGRVLFHYHAGSMTRRSGGLHAICPEGFVEINPLDAARLGVVDGDLVRVSSRRGKVSARARVVERPVPGVVFMTFHFAEAAANLLTISALDPIAKIPEFKACAVRVEPASSGLA